MSKPAASLESPGTSQGRSRVRTGSGIDLGLVGGRLPGVSSAGDRDIWDPVSSLGIHGSRWGVGSCSPGPSLKGRWGLRRSVLTPTSARA